MTPKQIFEARPTERFISMVNYQDKVLVATDGRVMELNLDEYDQWTISEILLEYIDAKELGGGND